MRANWPWDKTLTVLKTIKMTLLRPPKTNFKMTVRADCAVPECSFLPLSIKALSHWLSGWRVSLWTGVRPPCGLPASRIKQTFLYTTLASILAFEPLAARLQLSVTVSLINSLILWSFSPLFDFTLYVKVECLQEKQLSEEKPYVKD